MQAVAIIYVFGVVIAAIAGLIRGDKTGDFDLLVLAPVWPIVYFVFMIRSLTQPRGGL